ncbi:MAG: hypothetical protein ACRD4Q_14505 [Candidatus Acidiferrales bacterium]
MDSRYNFLKIRVLSALENRNWANPPSLAAFLKIYPARSIYTYLLRLHRWGLVLRRRDVRGLLAYRLSARGRDRLAWLRKQEE